MFKFNRGMEAEASVELGAVRKMVTVLAQLEAFLQKAIEVGKKGAVRAEHMPPSIELAIPTMGWMTSVQIS